MKAGLTCGFASLAALCAAGAVDPRTVIESEIAASDLAIAEGQAVLKDVVSLTDYGVRMRRTEEGEVWTESLEQALLEHEVVTIPARVEPYLLDRTVIVPSRRRIEARGATVRLATGVKTVMLRNADAADGTLAPIPFGMRGADIAIVGGRWEDNQTSRCGYGGSGRYNLLSRAVGNFYGVSALFFFNNVDRFSVRDATFVRCGGFAVQTGDGNGRLFEHIRFDDCFADGLHLNGNLSRVHVKDVRGKVGDDLVAMNAYDWLDSSVDFGPQRFFLCEDIELVLKDGKGYPAIRILPAVYRYRDGSVVDCSISDVIFRRVKGVMTYKMYMQTPRYRIGHDPEWGAIGSGGNIHFEDLEIDLTRPIDMLGQYADSEAPCGHFGAFEICANLSSVSLRNITMTFHADRWPLTHFLCVGPKSCREKVKDGPDFEYFDPYVSCKVGVVRIENLKVRGAPPKNLVHVADFKDINSDGRSTGHGEVATLNLTDGLTCPCALDRADGKSKE